MTCFNPLNKGGVRADLPVFIPKGHPLAKLAMRDAHCRGNRGRDATVSLFRNRFWTPSGNRLGKKIKDACQLCRLRNGVLMKQIMGSLPIERTKPSTPFNHSMVDLFGPYQVRVVLENFSTLLYSKKSQYSTLLTSIKSQYSCLPLFYIPSTDRPITFP